MENGKSVDNNPKQDNVIYRNINGNNKTWK